MCVSAANAGGDVIGFVTKKENIGFREAFERLNNNPGSSQRSAVSKQHKDKGNGKSITPLPPASPLSLRGDKRKRYSKSSLKPCRLFLSQKLLAKESEGDGISQSKRHYR